MTLLVIEMFGMSIEGHFDEFLFSQPVKGQWQLLPSLTSASEGSVVCGGPDMRGGHQMCMDGCGFGYLYGGWGGNKDKADLWKLNSLSGHWTCLYEDTTESVSG